MHLLRRAAAALLAVTALSTIGLGPARADDGAVIDCQADPVACEASGTQRLANLTLPVVMGDASAGSTVSVTTGRWAQTEGVTYYYAWQRERQNSVMSFERDFDLGQGPGGMTIRANVIARWTDPQTGTLHTGQAYSNWVTVTGARTTTSAQAPRKVKAGKRFSIKVHATNPIGNMTTQIDVLRKGRLIAAKRPGGNGKVVDVTFGGLRLPEGKHRLTVRYFVGPDDRDYYLPSATTVTIKAKRSR